MKSEKKNDNDTIIALKNTECVMNLTSNAMVG